MADYQSTLYKFPHDNVDDMEVFVKQWLRMDVDAENCREVILWLQKYYNKRAEKGLKKMEEEDEKEVKPESYLLMWFLELILKVKVSRHRTNQCQVVKTKK
ncbi:hypothetical protein ACOSQ2_030888 [Xanthoceras sorbifolium]